jgi:acyl-CoA synthetase (AMP-forming)/AMP-acid ligase II
VRVLDVVPVSPSGKVLRKELRKLVEAEEAAAAGKEPQAKL